MRFSVRYLIPIQLRYLLGLLRRLRGVHPRSCPICGFHGRFQAFGYPVRFDALCPKCGSLERHRLLIFLDKRFELIPRGQKILHFAPEAIITNYLREKTHEYVSADLIADNVDRRENIECMSFSAQSFDVVLCSHVLEHVDDRSALEEVRRVLVQGGRFICMVPIVEGWETTYENAALRTDSEREMHFGQCDHIRVYGRDFRARVEKSGFVVRECTASGSETAMYGFLPGEKVFLCTPIDSVGPSGHE